MTKENKSIPKLIYWATWLALAVSLSSLGLFMGILDNSGDTGIALGLALILLLYFVSAPLHCVIVILLILQRLEGYKSQFKWVYFYLVLTVVGHLFVFARYGAFDGVIADFAKFKRTFDEPEQVELENALRRGPPSNMQEVRSALTEGADPNGSIEGSPIPFLVKASRRTDVPVIQALLEAGADPNKRATIVFGYKSYAEINNPSPIDAAAYSRYEKRTESIELLIAAGADPSQSLIKLGACLKGDWLLYERGNELGVSNTLLDANDNNCLHYVAETNQLAFLQRLLNDPDFQQRDIRVSLASANKSNHYPLDMAIVNKHYEMAFELAKLGGTTNLSWTAKRVLDNPSKDFFVMALKVLIQYQPVMDINDSNVWLKELDLDGNGKLDKVGIVKSKTGGESQLPIVIWADGKIQTIDRKGKLEYPAAQDIEIAPKSVLKPLGLQGKIKGDGFIVHKIDSSSAVLYWDGERFRSQWMGD